MRNLKPALWLIVYLHRGKRDGSKSRQSQKDHKIAVKPHKAMPLFFHGVLFFLDTPIENII